MGMDGGGVSSLLGSISILFMSASVSASVVRLEGLLEAMSLLLFLLLYCLLPLCPSTHLVLSRLDLDRMGVSLMFVTWALSRFCFFSCFYLCLWLILAFVLSVLSRRMNYVDYGCFTVCAMMCYDPTP